ncbi:PQQ-dependent sugar dehydrogenase [Parvularcula dongshanensis]|uniref:Glucose/arabinose dehydrogenase n=1 Tax=Parvularcula dongshanensis TaxID=1173995 RepID=A0A840I2C0_9PROT|nr:PQQ-dependent sugar dehydrogenase [Parvularcula dongshanensis]MBB4658431.1 glucose/arabinose dehydrogenase [Parvularcula dongshanensis]
MTPVLLFLAASLALPPQGPAPTIGEAPSADPSRYTVETITDALDHPWSIAFLPEGPGAGDVLVSERPGRLRIVRDGRLLEEPVTGLPEVYEAGQAGLFEVSPSPDFARTGLLYLTYAAGMTGDNTLALARARYVPTPQGGRLEALEVLFEAVPHRETDAHYGGRIAWLGDGTLLLTSGEGYAYRHQAQAMDSHLGKVLRLDRDGRAPADNPFQGVPGVLPEIWSYGHRNPQAITTLRGGVFEAEHGPRGGDELNLIERGANYGWPAASYGMDYSGAFITPFATWEGTEQPLVQWTPSIAPSSLTVYDGVLFPAWRGQLLMSALAYRHVRLIDPDDPIRQEELFGELGSRVRDVAVAPDGSVWLALEADEGRGGRLVRVTPSR